jgi:hypothetical protein
MGMGNDHRPDPDALLRSLKQEDERRRTSGMRQKHCLMDWS